MSERIKVPDFMIEAGENSGAGCGRRSVEMILEAALQWLSKNPIHPSPEQWRRLFSDWGDRINASSTMGKSPHPIEDQLRFTVIEWQRRMFRMEEPLPDPFEGLLDRMEKDAPEGAYRIEVYSDSGELLAHRALNLLEKAKTAADPDEPIRDLLPVSEDCTATCGPDDGPLEKINMRHAVREAFRRGKESK